MKRAIEPEEGKNALLARVNDYASGLEATEVYRLREALNHSLSETYAIKASFEAGPMFHDGGEIWLRHILAPLARVEHLFWFLCYRTVSRFWLNMMSRLRTLVIPPTCDLMSAPILLSIFPNITSLSCCAILMESIHLLSGLRRLKIYLLMPSYDISKLVNLTSLSIEACGNGELLGLKDLVNLESLSLTETSNQYLEVNLSALVKLKSVKLRNSRLCLSSVSSKLTYFASNRVQHFIDLCPEESIELRFYQRIMGWFPEKEYERGFTRMWKKIDYRSRSNEAWRLEEASNLHYEAQVKRLSGMG